MHENPYGRPRLTDDELLAAADAIARCTDYAIVDTSARILARAALQAVRSKSFEWDREAAETKPAK